MAATVSVSQTLLEAIISSEWKGYSLRGFLIGPQQLTTSTNTIAAVWHSDMIDLNEVNEDISECLSHFPGGSSVVGFVYLPECSKSSVDSNPESFLEEFEERYCTASSWLEQMGLVQAFVLCLWPSDDGSCKYTVLLMSNSSVKPVTVVNDTEQDAETSVRLQLKGGLPLVITTETTTEEAIKAELDHELTKLERQVQAGNLIYGFEDNTILLQSGGTVVGDSQWNSCRELSKHFTSQEKSDARTKARNRLMKPPIPMTMLLRATTEQSSVNQYAPIIRHQTGSLRSTQLTLPVDILVEADPGTSMFDLYSIITEAVARQLKAVFECLQLYTQSGKLHTPEVFHFKPIDIPVTIVYPRGAEESELEKEREILHRRLCLPMGRPALRRGCAGHFLRQAAPSGYLLNTHIGLPDPAVKTVPSIVQGFYSYHHYMQDRFDDDKWGCAYRSLQTIVSWFKYQGYTDREIPTHKEIQRALVDIGDKEEKFVGSKQWIGSFEVSYVLDQLLGVTSKFINVNAGSELSTTGQQLTNHFQTQGTPVMIGGGVLAHTILGVAYDELTGVIKFLILDPHYTGGEDIRTIQEKGWCGWKDMSFWNQTAHYNMCLPQRPVAI